MTNLRLQRPDIVDTTGFISSRSSPLAHGSGPYMDIPIKWKDHSPFSHRALSHSLRNT
jgi:hypothetical protein